jgi:hypothetical protein
MLDGLDQIDWTALGEHDIPGWLKHLSFGDRGTRREAFSKLSDALTPWEVFDGLYSEELPQLVKREAAYLIIPFLIQMLEIQELENKEFMLSLLHHLAWYIDLGEYVAENDHEQYQYYARRLYDAVYKGIETYRELAQSNNYEVRQSAKSLLDILGAKTSS